ncbi:MAG TPA: GatB/YqeY domain-containing protein [Candidatus Dormibacteraeota bacterium]|nr:GatB/YqeY domain-containing protein [Candidatus Dormibacteraeota bacterium]
MSLFERIERELVEARKARDPVRLSVLGLLKAEAVKAAKEPGAGGVADDRLVTAVVRREIKRREEAAQAYTRGGRGDAADRERAEAEVLRAYLPPQLDEDELEREVRAVIEEVRPGGARDFGAVMRAAAARLGDRAEGARIAAVARRLMGSGG